MALLDVVGIYFGLESNSVLVVRCPLGGCCALLYGVIRCQKTGIVALVRSLNSFQQGELAILRRVSHLRGSSCLVALGSSVST